MDNPTDSIRRVLAVFDGAVRTARVPCLLAVAGSCLLAGEARAQGNAQADRAALVALYHATDGPSWTNSTNWLSTEPLSEWFGVTTESGRVTALDSLNERELYS